MISLQCQPGGRLQSLLSLTLMVAICCNLVLSAPSSYYLKRYVSTGPPFSENWFPNDTTVRDTVVAPNGSVYVLDSSQALYKFDDFSHGIQKVQLTPPDNPPSSWAGTDIRTIQLWIHPVSYDPYLFRMRWSNATNSSESVLIDIIWYPGFNFSFVNSTHRPEIVTLNTTMSPGSSFVNFSIGRETQSDGEPIQLALYNGDNYYYLALVDMNIGTQTPAFLSEYSNSIPASIKLFGIVLECGRQVDLACLITSDNAVSTNFLFTPSAIQPISNSSLDWYFTPDTKINLYQNPHPNVTVIVVNDNFHLVFHVTQTSVSIQNGYLIPMSDTLPYDFSVTKNVFTVLTAVAEFSGSIDKPDINIKIYIHTINNNDGYLAMAELRTLQNETVSRLIKQPDESLTVVGTTFGNYSAPSSLTGLVDPDGFAYQALFFVRFLNLRIVSQSFEFINIENITIQIVLVLDGVTQADSPDVIASMSQRIGSPFWVNTTSLKIDFEGVSCGRQTMTINLLGITPNPSVETSVDVPPIITSVTPLNGTVGTVVAVNISNFGDNDPSNVNLWLGDFYCGMVPGFDKGIIPCMVPDGGGSNLPIFVIVNTVRFQTPFNFSYFPPEIASVSPANASTTGPISFTIVGRYFGRCDYLCGVLNGFPNLEITVGGVRCNDIRHYDTDLTCSVQQGIAGIDLDVIVSYYGHNSSTSSVAKYSSLPPSILRTTQTRVLFSPANPSVPFFGVEGLNFGPPDTMVSLIFRTSDGLNYSACYSSVSLNHNSMNCELLQDLPSPHIYNVSILVAGQYSNADRQVKYGNFPPIANSINVSINEDTIYQLSLFGNDPDGDPIEVYLTELPKNGKLFQFDATKPNALGVEADLGGFTEVKVIEPFGRMMYIPNPNFNGNDSFVFKVADRVNNVMTNSTPATVSIFVSSVPDPPVAYERLVSVQEDSAVAINITITDVDTPLANVLIVIDSLPSNGHIGFLENSASLVNITAVPYTIPPGHHTIKYYPAPDYFGPDRLTLHANDGLNDSNIVSVSIVVQPLNDYPIARAGFITTNEDQGSIIRFRVDDVDQPPSVKQRIKILTWNNTLGDLYQVNSDGIKYGFSLGPNTEVADELNRLWFEPKSDASGYINLTFTATDALNAISDPALITIQTISINDEPFIYGCNKDIILVDTPTINITLTAGDPDKDDALFFHLISVPRKGRLLHEGSEILQNDMIRRGMSGTSDSSVVLRFEGSKMGGGNPFDNFTYVVFDEAGARTEPCTVHFKVRCTPPQVNNIFEMNGDICAPCPKGAICSQDGSTPIFAGRGYWLHPGDNKTLLTCMPESACVGQQSQICAKGYEGPRCGMCEKGHYRRNLECIPCFENQTIIVVFVLIALGLSVVFLYVMINFSGKGPSVALVGIAINFFQTILVIRDFHINFPPEFHSLMNVLSILNLNIQLTPPECLFAEGTFGYSLKLRIAFAFPLVLILLSFLVSGIGNYITAEKVAAYFRDKKPNIQSKSSTQLVVIRMVNLILSWVFMSVATNSMALFDCTTEADGHSYMDIDPSVKCWVAPMWWEDVPLAVAACILYVAGIPLYFFMQLFAFYQRKRNSPFWQKARDLSHRIMRMDHSFKPESQYFTFFQILQKLAMVAISMFFTKYTTFQVALMILVLMATSGIYTVFQPYSVRQLNFIEILSGVCSIIVLLFGQVYSSASTPESFKRLVTVAILFVIFTFIIAVLVVAFVTAVFPYIKDTLRPLEKIGEFMRSQKSSLGVHDMTER